MFHHHFGKAETVDPRLAEEARKKLSDSNFNMGQSELKYKTMANSQFKPFIRVNNSTINDRKKNAIRNSITNFLDQKTGLFEKPIDTQKFGAIPVKNQGPDSRLSDIVNEIKSAHFELGRNGKDNFSYQTNKLYGSNQP
jgi:hypothetical protein